MDSSDERTPRSALFPEIEPFQFGYLNVGGRHEIYYEQAGNPGGKPLFVLHGGPGAGCSPEYRRWADPDLFRIVLHDQRGAGRSRLFGELRENTTRHLVHDIEDLRRHLGIERMILLGGSWGSTLALAYAETHPDRVSGLILRGVFLATKEESERFFPSGTAALRCRHAADRRLAVAQSAPQSELRIVEASGHSASDLEMQRALVEAVRRFE